MTVIPQPRTPADDDPWTLVERAQNGDTDAFAQLYLRFNGAIYSFLFKRCGNGHLSADLAADVWEKALRKVGTVHRERATPLAWLTIIARNRLIDYIRSGWNKYEFADDEAVHADRPAPGQDIADEVADRADHAALRRALNLLSEEQREAILLTHFRGMTSKDAGLVMGKSSEAVKALTLRGRRGLIRHLPADLSRS